MDVLEDNQNENFRISRCPIGRAHRGCHGSETLSIPVINFTDEMSEWVQMSLYTYVSNICFQIEASVCHKLFQEFGCRPLAN
jgi:hypothetical protein